VLILVHAVALLSGAFAAGGPASDLEHRMAESFLSYHQLIDQGYSYRFYVEPPPTPVVLARVHYADGRPDEQIRLPERGLLPRLRYQRQLALANHLFSDFNEARQFTGDGSNSKWGASYARHIAYDHPGAESVTLSVQMHLIPDLARVHESQQRGGKPIDLDADEYFTTPERIGEYPCAGF
jgi:hypothetical protein